MGAHCSCLVDNRNKSEYTIFEKKVMLMQNSYCYNEKFRCKTSRCDEINKTIDNPEKRAMAFEERAGQKIINGSVKTIIY